MGGELRAGLAQDRQGDEGAHDHPPAPMERVPEFPIRIEDPLFEVDGDLRGSRGEAPGRRRAVPVRSPSFWWMIPNRFVVTLGAVIQRSAFG
jgi:hypothetical protein